MKCFITRRQQQAQHTQFKINETLSLPKLCAIFATLCQKVVTENKTETEKQKIIWMLGGGGVRSVFGETRVKIQGHLQQHFHTASR